jgi:hypothetical protein
MRVDSTEINVERQWIRVEKSGKLRMTPTKEKTARNQITVSRCLGLREELIGRGNERGETFRPPLRRKIDKQTGTPSDNRNDR